MRDQEFGTEAGQSGIDRDQSTRDHLVDELKPANTANAMETPEARRDRERRESDARAERERHPPRPAGYGEGREFTVQNEAARSDISRERKSGGTDMLSMLAEIHARLEAVEKRSQETRDIVNTAKDRGDVGFDTAHVAHIMQKHFYHDQPEIPDAEKPVARFDPFTGEPIAPINPPPKFDPATGQRLQ
jgi:hypothetical protein